MLTGSSKRWLPIAVWLGLTGALLFMLPALPWRETAAALGNCAPFPLALAVLANAAILPLWALEWQILTPASLRVSFAAMFRIVAVSAAVLNSIPFLAGEASAVALLVSRAGFSAAAALSLLAMDQLLVGIAKVTVIAAAVVVAPLPGWMRDGALALAIAVVVLLGALIAFSRMQAARNSSDTSALAGWMARLRSWSHNLEALREPGRAARVIALAFVKKLLELAAILLVQIAFGFEPMLATGLLVLAGLAVATLVPIAPANLGVYEATVYAVYVTSGISAGAALGMALVQHLAFLLPPLLIGYSIATVRSAGDTARASDVARP